MYRIQYEDQNIESKRIEDQTFFFPQPINIFYDLNSTAYHLKQVHIALKQESQRNKVIAQNNVSFLNLVPYKNMQPLSLNLFHESNTSTNTPIQLSCTVLITTNLDNTSLFAEYIQLSNAIYVNTDGIHIPKDYKLLKGLCHYLQPYYYNTIEDESSSPNKTKEKSNSNEQSHKRTTSMNIYVGEVTILKSNIDLPKQLLLKIGSDYVILADLYDAILREIGYDILKVNAVGNSLELTSPSIQIQCQSFKASELAKQIDKQIDLHHGTREVEVFAENSNAVEINFDKVIPSVDRGHKSVNITSPRQIQINDKDMINTPPLSEPMSPTSDHECSKFDVYFIYIIYII